MDHAEITRAYVALMAKFSAEAKARTAEIQERMRLLAVESLGLVLGEFERLRQEGVNDFAVEASTVALVRQQIETEEFVGPMNLAVMELLMTTTDSYSAIRHCSSEVQARREVLRKEMQALLVEHLDFMSGELRRLSLVCPGREGTVYAEASAVLGLMREQMETQNPADPEIGGPVGALLDAVRGAARGEVRRRALGS